MDYTHKKKGDGRLAGKVEALPGLKRGGAHKGYHAQRDTHTHTLWQVSGTQSEVLGGK